MEKNKLDAQGFQRREKKKEEAGSFWEVLTGWAMPRMSGTFRKRVKGAKKRRKYTRKPAL